MRLPTIGLAAALVAATTFSMARADTAAGVRDIAVAVPERGHDIAATLWYPAAAGGDAVLVGENGVFKGALAYRNAPPGAGRFPVIVLSHGGFRAAADLDSWIASRLAARGFVVAVPHPPGPAELNASDAPAELWLRPQDMSATLSAVWHDPQLAGKVDTRQAGALGFLLGGTAALTLAGATLDGPAYQRSCDTPGTNSDCAWFAKSGVDLRAVDTVQLEESHLDGRFATVVAIEPELTGVIAPKSLAEAATPVLLVGLGEAVQLPGIAAETFSAAARHDVFNECKAKGLAILREEGGDEALCKDGPLPRAAVHEALAEMIADAFEQHQGD